MTNLQFLPRCEVRILGNVLVLAVPAVTVTTSAAIGSLGARLVTHLSPKLVGGLFAVSTLITCVSFFAMECREKPEDEKAKFLLATATGGLCGAILCHKTVVPLSVTSAVMLPILITVAFVCGFFFSELIIKEDNLLLRYGSPAINS